MLLMFPWLAYIICYSWLPYLKDRLEMERMTVVALRTLRGELAGKYFPLLGMSPDVQKQMTEDHFLFRDDDP